jgi:hypothetical protein
MKHLKTLPILFLVFLLSCKEEDKAPRLASVNVVNATVNLPAVKVNYFGRPIGYAAYTNQVNYSANRVYSLPTSGPVSLVIVPSADTLKVVYTGELNLPPGDIYSLYLTILLKESIPALYADSIMGVRFINLSPNSSPVAINILATPAVKEVSSLAYKQGTDFKTYPAKKANSTYVFQVRDAATAALLATYTLTTTRFLNVTLALKGLAGTTTGTNALGVMRVNNY